MLLYLIILGGLGILFVAALGALREAVRQRARPRGFLVALAAAALALLGFWAVLI
ncbi:MAG: hypothetical protein JNJ80_01735 [Gemmatimonadetes bacterium]|nr:hypothetical protein [Gemmatimonadota bacterium]